MLSLTQWQFLTILTIFWQFLTILTIFCQLLLIMTMTMTRHENESSKDNDKDNLRDLWDINHSWESEFRTIWVTWQLRVTQDSICNSCDVLKHSAVWSAQKMPQIRRLSKNLKLSSTHVNLKTCSEFPQIGVCLSGSLQATQYSCNESEGWGGRCLRHMGRPLIRLPVALENFLFLQHLFWQKKAWDKTFVSWSTPFLARPYFSLVSDLVFSGKTKQDASHPSPAACFYLLPDKQRGREVSIWPELWDIRLIAARRLSCQFAGCGDIFHSSLFWEKQLT